MFDLAIYLAFPAAMAFAGSMDLLTMTIPNRISLALIALFLLAVPFTPLGWVGFAWHVAAGLVMLAIGIGMFAMGWLGGGDAKLMAAAALWFGFEFLHEYLLLATVFGGLLALAVVSFRKHELPPWPRIPAWVERLHTKGGGIPYGVALAASALCLYPSTVWFSTFAS